MALHIQEPVAQMPYPTRTSRVIINSKHHTSHECIVGERGTLRRAQGPNAYRALLPRTYRNVVAVRLVDYKIPLPTFARIVDETVSYTFVPGTVIRQGLKGSNDTSIMPSTCMMIATEEQYSLSDTAGTLAGVEALVVAGTVTEADNTPLVYVNEPDGQGVDDSEEQGHGPITCHTPSAFLRIPQLESAYKGLSDLMVGPKQWRAGAYYRVGDVVFGTSTDSDGASTPSHPRLYRRKGSDGVSVDLTVTDDWEVDTRDERKRMRLLENIMGTFHISGAPQTRGRAFYATPKQHSIPYEVHFSTRSPGRFSALDIEWLDEDGQPYVFAATADLVKTGNVIITANNTAEHTRPEANYLRYEPHILVLEIEELDV